MRRFFVMIAAVATILAFSIDIPKEFGKSKVVEYKVRVAMADGIRIYYPQFSSKHRKLNEIIHNFVEKRWHLWQNSLLEQLKGYKEKKTAGMPKYYLLFSVERFDDRVISILFKEMVYTGGAHPINYLFAVNYDFKLEKKLSLRDLFINKYDYKKVINKKVKSFFVMNKQSVINKFKTIRDDQDFYLSDYGIVVFFQRYEYTCYSFGSPNIPISYREFGKSFKKEYLP